MARYQINLRPGFFAITMAFIWIWTKLRLPVDPLARFLLACDRRMMAAGDWLLRKIDN